MGERVVFIACLLSPGGKEKEQAFELALSLFHATLS